MSITEDQRDRICDVIDAAKNDDHSLDTNEYLAAIESILDDEPIDFAEDEEEVESPCDECDEEATNFWPNLKEPVQMCDSCEHNARRSGWGPGQ